MNSESKLQAPNTRIHRIIFTIDNRTSFYLASHACPPPSPLFAPLAPPLPYPACPRPPPLSLPLSLPLGLPVVVSSLPVSSLKLFSLSSNSASSSPPRPLSRPSCRATSPLCLLSLFNPILCQPFFYSLSLCSPFLSPYPLLSLFVFEPRYSRRIESSSSAYRAGDNSMSI